MIGSLVKARSLRLECAKVLHEDLLVLYGSETMLWREKGRYKTIVVHMDSLRGLLSIRKIYVRPNTQMG